MTDEQIIWKCWAETKGKRFRSGDGIHSGIWPHMPKPPNVIEVGYMPEQATQMGEGASVIAGRIVSFSHNILGRDEQGALVFEIFGNLDDTSVKVEGWYYAGSD